MCKFNSYRVCVALVGVLVYANLGCLTVEAGPFGRFGNRRTPSTHNITENAPPAPEYCPEGDCDMPMMQNIMQVPVVDMPIMQMPLQGLQMPTMAPSVGVTNEGARVDRLISAMEKRLGIEANPAVQGSPTGLFQRLPRVRVELQDQDGTVIDEVIIDLKQYVLDQLR